MDPMLVRQLMLGAIPPGLGAALLFALLWNLALRRREAAAGVPFWLYVLTPLLLGMGLAAMHPLIVGPYRFPPASADQSFWILGLVAGATGSIAALALRARPAGTLTARRVLVVSFLLSASLGVFAAWMGSRTVLPRSSGVWIAGHLGGHAVLAGIFGAAGAWIATRETQRLGIITLLVLASGASQLLVVGQSSLKLGQMSGVVAALLGGLLVATFRLRPTNLGAPVAITLLGFSAAAMYQGTIFGNAPEPRGLLFGGLLVLGSLLAAAFSGSWFGPKVSALSGWKRGVVLMALTGLCVAAGLGTALATQPPPQAEAEYDY